ncbi:FIG01036274: hypothetical protein [hydrothermal vent metagenome]|uniref:DUF1585 domain-containing protein n=1 Tax=hydrothermal vent metagenome TaxID=652676 RepID=A0A3B0ZWC5_9ZZZZ
MFFSYIKFQHQSGCQFMVAVLLCFLVVSSAYSGSREQAKRIHDRIAGVPPSALVLNSMAAYIDANEAISAANEALENSAFYHVTLKNMVTPWTNEEQTVFAPLNDYTATVIGIVRDDEDFRKVLYDNILYVGAGSLGLPAYSMSNNDHYVAMETQGIDLQKNLVQTAQSSVMDIPASASAGIMTSRAAARAFLIDGTNRAMFRFTMMNYLCNDMEQVKDITRAHDRVRQDVSRSPGGDSRIFMNSCVGCHSGMDPLAQAYAYYDFEYTDDADTGRMVYNGEGVSDPVTGSRVQGKYLINASNFKYGYVTTNDNWSNYWRNGQNALLGWDVGNQGLLGNGAGAKSMGMELANSEAFAQCQVEKVFKTICLRKPGTAADRTQISTMVTSFKTDNYNLKNIFAQTAVYCRGD